jgi:perosamine synthetase
MNDIAAAIGIVQLAKLTAGNKRRAQIANIYSERLSSLNKSGHIYIRENLYQKDQYVNSWHLYPILAWKRDALMEYLASKDISTGVHYRPIHIQPYYKSYQGRLPVVERIWTELISLPMHLVLSDNDVNFVCDNIEEFYRNNYGI